jgi:hypothetical protein
LEEANPLAKPENPAKLGKPENIEKHIENK